MSHQTIATTIIVTASLSIMAIERRWPYTPGQALFRKFFWQDFVWYSVIFSSIFSFVVALLVERFIAPGVYDAIGGREHVAFVTHWPVWVQLVFFLFQHDFVVYWWHRYMHINKYLWRIHEPHHSGREVDQFSGSRAHVFEAIIMGTMEFAPMVLLGASPETIVYKGALDAVWGMYIHSNIDVRMGWLQKVINGPEMHRWHHCRDVHNINFATKLAIWDWLFGTAYMPEGKKPERYGIDVEWPGNLVKQQMIAFRPFDEQQNV